MVRLMLFGISHGAAALLAITCSRAQKLRAVVQGIMTPVISAAILLLVLYLEWTMPSWEAIYQSVYG